MCVMCVMCDRDVEMSEVGRRRVKEVMGQEQEQDLREIETGTDRKAGSSFPFPSFFFFCSIHATLPIPSPPVHSHVDARWMTDIRGWLAGCPVAYLGCRLVSSYLCIVLSLWNAYTEGCATLGQSSCVSREDLSFQLPSAEGYTTLSRTDTGGGTEKDECDIQCRADLFFFFLRLPSGGLRRVKVKFGILVITLFSPVSSCCLPA